MQVVGMITSFLAGVTAYAWWIHPDTKNYKKKIAKLEQENEQFRRYILRNFKVKMYQRGVEIDTDDA